MGFDVDMTAWGMNLFVLSIAKYTFSCYEVGA